MKLTFDTKTACNKGLNARQAEVLNSALYFNLALVLN